MTNKEREEDRKNRIRTEAIVDAVTRDDQTILKQARMKS